MTLKIEIKSFVKKSLHFECKISYTMDFLYILNLIVKISELYNILERAIRVGMSQFLKKGHFNAKLVVSSLSEIR